MKTIETVSISSKPTEEKGILKKLNQPTQKKGKQKKIKDNKQET